MQLKTPLSDILFLDVETVPQNEVYDKLSDRQQALWDKKSQQWRKESTADEVYERAGIYAEFGKIVCITIGNIVNEQLHIKSFYGDDEHDLLTRFNHSLEKFCKGHNRQLCAHNGKEFDFPYLCRRMLIQGIPLPKILQIQGKKPWEVPFLDTLDLWRFGDYKNYTSLDLLCEIFHIPTPKDNIDGSMVGHIYWQEKQLERIVHYCEKDVIALTRLFLRMHGEPTLTDEQINIIATI